MTTLAEPGGPVGPEQTTIDETRRKPRVTMLSEANPYPEDVRVRHEAESLAGAGYRVEVIAPRGPGQPRTERINGVEVRRFRGFDGSQHGAVGFLVEYLIAVLALHGAAVAALLRGASVLHIHNPPDVLFPAAALFRLVGRRVVFDQHDLVPEMVDVKLGPGLFSRLARVCERLTYAVCDHVIAPNGSYAAIACQRGRKSPEQITQVRNAPPRSWIELPLRTRDGQLTSPHLMYVGAISVQDGVEAVALIMAALRAASPSLDPRLTVVGDGDRRAALEAELDRYGVRERVTITGWVASEHVPELLRTADICIEPAPATELNRCSTMTKIAEYLALGRPVVAYDMKESRRTVGDAAMLVPPGDVDAFAARIAALAHDPALRARLARKGRRRAEEISWEHSASALLGAYEALAG